MIDWQIVGGDFWAMWQEAECERQRRNAMPDPIVPEDLENLRARTLVQPNQPLTLDKDYVRSLLERIRRAEEKLERACNCLADARIAAATVQAENERLREALESADAPLRILRERFTRALAPREGTEKP